MANESFVDVVGEAARAWPAIALSPERFRAYLDERAGFVHASDLYLACGCVDRIAPALAAFDEHHIRSLPPRLQRLGLAASVVEEMQQVLREKLLVAAPGAVPRLATYAGRGPLHAWVRAAAVRTALNLLRATWREDAVGDDDPSSPSVGTAMSPERELRHAAYGEAITNALHDATRGLDAEDRLLLQMHFADGFSAEQIGRTLGINRVTAHRRLVRAYRQIERSAIALLRQRLGVTADDLESVLSITRSRLEVSVRTLLGG